MISILILFLGMVLLVSSARCDSGLIWTAGSVLIVVGLGMIHSWLMLLWLVILAATLWVFLIQDIRKFIKMRRGRKEP